MIIRVTARTVSASRESGENRMPTESALLYALKLMLNDGRYHRAPDCPLDFRPEGSAADRFIKKPMWRDRHMVDNGQHYLRTADGRWRNPMWAVHSEVWALRGLHEDFNDGGAAVFSLKNIAPEDARRRMEAR
jgi:hypothetical protein